MPQLDSINASLLGTPTLDEDALHNLSGMAPDVLEMALSAFDKPEDVLSISTFVSRCSALKFGDDMDASFSAVQKTFSLVNDASEHYEDFMGAKKKQPRLASFPSVIRGYVEALTKSYQQFRIPQELPIDKVNSLYAKCGQAYEKWVQDRRSEARVVVQQEVIGAQMGKLKKSYSERVGVPVTSLR